MLKVKELLTKILQTLPTKADVSNIPTKPADVGVIVDYNGGSPDNQVTSVPHNTWTVLGSITLTDPGVYIIMATARYNANANGYRGIFLATNNSPDSSGGLQVATTDYRAPANGTFTFCSFTSTRTVTERTTYYIKAIQTSGSQLTVAPRVSTVRVGEV